LPGSDLLPLSISRCLPLSHFYASVMFFLRQIAQADAHSKVLLFQSDFSSPSSFADGRLYWNAVSLFHLTVSLFREEKATVRFSCDSTILSFARKFKVKITCYFLMTDFIYIYIYFSIIINFLLNLQQLQMQFFSCRCLFALISINYQLFLLLENICNILL